MPATQVSYFAQFSKILSIEANSIELAIKKLKKSEVEKAVKYILECKGKVVLMGVGKSGIIGMKIAATLSSTGTPAIFLHAGEAMHGDLGIIQKGDVIILLSNSGETEEVLHLLPHLELRKLPIIAIVGNDNSSLALKANAILNSAVDKEACPLNLAPTTSTTVALAIGDALAMTVMEEKGITAKDFAVNHPSGKLGKRLALRVKDLISGSDNPTILPHTQWKQIVEAIGNGKMGGVNITDKNGILAGIITDGDLRRVMQNSSPETLFSLKASEIMTKNPTVTNPDMLAYDALRLMEQRNSQIALLPVVDANMKCLGIIRIHDIIGRL